MHSPFKIGSKTVALMAVLLLVGAAGAQEAKPAAPAAAPQIHKMTINNGLTTTVSYTVEGGSPHLQALAQTLQFTENEINLTTELQKLRLGIVANEQTLARVQTSQLLGLGPISTPGYAGCYPSSDSALKQALVPGLAREATPATAFELINLQEQVQTAIQAEQRKAAAPAPGQPPAKPNAPQAAPMGMAAPPPNAPVAGPMAAPQVGASAQTIPQQVPLPLNPDSVLQASTILQTAPAALAVLFASYVKVRSSLA
jgi:hypothetical protein